MQSYDGEEIKNIRKALGFTQEKFASAIGVSRPSVSMMESGNMAVSRETSLLVERLANAHLPDEISVSTFGSKFVVVATKRNGKRNVHVVQHPAHKTREAATIAARSLAGEKLAHFRA